MLLILSPKDDYYGVDLKQGDAKHEEMLFFLIMCFHNRLFSFLTMQISTRYLRFG